jgi:hypothetical protein
VVREMNRLRMLIDISHTSDETVEAVLEVSEYPVIASHSCCWSLCNHPRNLTDELIRKIAGRGGVIQIAYYPPSLDAEAAAVFERNWECLRGNTSPEVTSGQDLFVAGFLGPLLGGFLGDSLIRRGRSMYYWICVASAMGSVLPIASSLFSLEEACHCSP